VSAYITGAGLALGGERGVDVLRSGRTPAGEFDAAAVLGRKGLLYKDRATRLALCAAHDALADAGLLGDNGLTVDCTTFAVIVSSNLGNLDTVCNAAAAIAAASVAAISPMDLPNASSNVVASSVAIRFGLRGPNLMLCNGSTGGLDAVNWATTLLAAGRADRVLVIGVETRNEVVARLLGTEDVFDGAVCVVVERHPSEWARATIGQYSRAGDLDSCIRQLAQRNGSTPDVLFTSRADAAPAGEPEAAPARDLAAIHGHASGALGVLQCAAALAWFADGSARRILATAGGGDEAAAALVLEATR
jgi:3-oxoacyl-[acyl-carrier-protein] synthase II